jgi:hypothetical protein
VAIAASKIRLFVTGLAILITIVGAYSGFAQQYTDAAHSDDLVILSKPRAGYTDLARRKKLQGTVVLRVVFRATGDIGEIIDVTKRKRDKLTKYGLTANAIAAAKGIKFVPVQRNGIAVDVVKLVEYVFTLY